MAGKATIHAHSPPPGPTRVADAEPLLASNNSAALDTIGCRPQVATCSRGHCEKTADKGNIVNLSDAVLTREETNILSKGLTFCPTTGHYNEFQLYQDLDKFARNMRLREYFHDRQPNPNQMILTNPEKQRASSFIHIFVEIFFTCVFKRRQAVGFRGEARARAGLGSLCMQSRGGILKFGLTGMGSAPSVLSH